ncbi:ParB/RepB/Spo0J family partition protein [Alkalimarinus alittae]|uniref:Probable chromosome-partitioning protein ParB n=1 Tax=Alkalimarinus alittae TaxID=2961619 RepID=A0ABY6N2D5_9ALTE|nr:ParB/RepB/Spo0J family partition protein [Alkalimarinus alittae]UZE96169.1 ParB/RepB/Spo0J family partition protein [Alkalimarinus alittae]
MVAKKRGLGERGLGALLAGSKVKLQTENTQDGELRELPVDLIQRGVYQPRRDMDPEALEELADSIRQQGVMQPIIVRPIAENRYEIIAGERRWRATQIAGLDRVPAIIRDVADDAAVAMALIENIQRENLNAMEEAMALQRLQDEFELTQQEVAHAVGKSRSTVTNLLRLIGLSHDVKVMLEHGDLEMGHGRAMLSLSPELQLQAANQVVAKSLSVRQTEALVRKLQEEKDHPKETKKVDPDIRRLQQDLSERIGAKVAINHNAKGKGKLVIEYSSVDELDGILNHIK